jgi:2'-5' RNA ligase
MATIGRATMGGVLRRAIVLFVPPPVCEQLDEIRRRWDPVMCGRIGCHITLVHDVTDHDRATELVAEVAARTAPFTVRLGAAAHWGKSAWGVYLHVDDPHGVVDAVQAQLASLEEARWARVPYRSHVTLVHSRTTPPETAAEAWAALESFDPGWEIDVGAIDIVEMEEATGWCSVERFELATAIVAD